MTDTAWGFLALAGLGLVFIGNVLRARRTDNVGCLGHLFVAAENMTVPEQILNRGGIALFVAGVVLSVVG